ncbi:DNA cytosine methyltransferase [uncultured Phascolarctobacterium sp.]|uniref:DNA cytosine methyltransferase n=1 Tax=uncultured Phascolarctobacterium sp. TaxID=512296 RepID=UPI002619C016|nr:DNA cytosine methyltransferase [uncultured Phascolarctobacterium sp.]
MELEVYSFFSGLGLLDLGFEKAGFNIVFVNEYNQTFLEAYQYARRNSKHIPAYGYSSCDVKKYLSDDEWEKTFPEYNQRQDKLVGFIGGPPCPDFSIAGKNQGKDGKNGQLTSVYISLIVKRQPDFFVFENVKGLYRTQKHRDFYDKMKRKLYRNGYSLFDSIENALEYGVPQNRDRLILVGFKRKTFGKKIDFQLGVHKKYKLENIKKVSWPTMTPFKINSKSIAPSNIIRELTIEYWFNKNDVQKHINNKDVFGVRTKEKFYEIKEGDLRGKSFKRLHRWRFSPTAAYGHNEVHLHPYLPRRISVAEALAIQSVNKKFVVKTDISLSDKFKMVGNGVPFLLAKGIAFDILSYILKYERTNKHE